jgi:hypothetical protein
MTGGSFLDKGVFGTLRFFVSWIFFWGLGSHILHVFGVVAIVAFEFPDLGLAADIDDFELTDEGVNEDFDGFDAQEILEFLDVGRLVDHLHEVLGAFLVVDAVDAGLGESNGELLHDVVAGLHYLGPWERLHFQEGVSCLSPRVPEFSFIFSSGLSYFDLS